MRSSKKAIHGLVSCISFMYSTDLPHKLLKLYIAIVQRDGRTDGREPNKSNWCQIIQHRHANPILSKMQHLELTPAIYCHAALVQQHRTH
jgi:hypothetical protein